MSIETRLANVERRLARTRLMNLGLLLGLTALVAGGAQSTQDTIRVKRLVIEDDGGNERVVIAGSEPVEGSETGVVAAGIWLKDAQGVVRLCSGVNSKNASYSQWRDVNGRTRVAALCSASGESSMQWLDAEGNLRIGGATLKNGDAAMMWLAPGNKSQIRVLTDKAGTAKFISGD